MRAAGRNSRGLWALACATALTWTLLAAADAPATFPGRDGPILYRGGDNALHALTPSGERRAVAPDLTFDAAASSDGRKVVFARSTDGYREALFSANLDGSQLTQLTPYTYNVTFLALSPDARTIYFSGGVIGTNGAVPGYSGLMRMRIGQPGVEVLAYDNDSVAFDVSPDGKRIIYEVSDYMPDGWGGMRREVDLWRMNSDGTGKRPFAATGVRSESVPSWSPDGRRVVYSSERLVRQGRGPKDDYTLPTNIRIVNANGKRNRQLTPPRTHPLSLPVFSPNGARIAYTKQGNLFSMRVRGEPRRKLLMKRPPRVDVYALSWAPRRR